MEFDRNFVSGMSPRRGRSRVPAAPGSNTVAPGMELIGWLTEHSIGHQSYHLTHQPTTHWIHLKKKQVSFKKEVGVMVIDLVFWLTVCLILKMCY